MTQQEVQSRYYYGLTEFEQEVFKQRWNDLVYWENLRKEQYEQQQREQEQEERQSGSGFWGALGKIIIGVVAGYVAYRATTYNSNTNIQLNQLQMQNTQMQWQLNNIQSDLRRLAY